MFNIWIFIYHCLFTLGSGQLRIHDNFVQKWLINILFLNSVMNKLSIDEKIAGFLDQQTCHNVTVNNTQTTQHNLPFSTFVPSWIWQGILLFTRVEFFKEWVLLALVGFDGPLISHSLRNLISFSLWNLAWSWTWRLSK